MLKQTLHGTIVDSDRPGDHRHRGVFQLKLLDLGQGNVGPTIQSGTEARSGPSQPRVTPTWHDQLLHRIEPDPQDDRHRRETVKIRPPTRHHENFDGGLVEPKVAALSAVSGIMSALRMSL